MTRLLLLLFFILPATVYSQRAVPAHGGVWVHDEAGVLSAGAKSRLEAILKAERDSTSNQIAVLVIPSLEGDVLEEYSLRVAEEWGIGKKKIDNGVLLLISIQDRKVRMETGKGLEGVLTDALSSRINRNEIAPHFRALDYDGGVIAGVVAIIQSIKGEYVNNDPPVQRRKARSPWTSLIFIVLIIIFAVRNRRGGGGGGGLGYWAAGSMLGSGMGRSSGSWGSGSDFGGGGGFGGGGSSDSW